MAEFIKSFRKTIDAEGGYVNDPDDPGGETWKGISRKNWPDWSGWQIIDSLKKLPDFPASLEKSAELREEVGTLYLSKFWNKLHGDYINSQEVADSIFDFGVNGGIETAIVMAQQIAGAKPDGVVGEKTLEAINRFNPDHFLAAFTVAKIARYLAICKKRPTSKKYFYGWVDRAINA